MQHSWKKRTHIHGKLLILNNLDREVWIMIEKKANTRINEIGGAVGPEQVSANLGLEVSWIETVYQALD